MDFEDKTSLIRLQDIAQKPPVKSESRSACFIVITGGQAGRLFRVDKDGVIVGRSADAGIRIDDEGVSRQHAKITIAADGHVLIEDLRSTNGTFCNGQKIEKHMLADGDKIQLGSATSILKFSYQDELEEDFQKRQYESATRDGLTNCYNKKYFLERLPAEFSFAQRHRKILTVLMADVDFFKKVNDVHGHPAGDAVLVHVSRILLNATRKSDVLARYGGEEFCLLMREVPLPDALLMAERVRQQVADAKIHFQDKVLQVTISIGIASFVGDNYISPDALLQAADNFLYDAKHQGRNCTRSILNAQASR